jgi:hypothetical protein
MSEEMIGTVADYRVNNRYTRWVICMIGFQSG